MGDIAEQIKRDHPEEVMASLQRITMPGTMLLEHLLPGDFNAHVRAAIVETGRTMSKSGRRELHVQTRPLEDGTHEVLAIGAISRDPGSTQTYLDAIGDFSARPSAGPELVRQYRSIYKSEGIINNAVNKIAALIGVGGRFKVRRAKRGKTRKAAQDLQLILDYLVSHVNAANAEAVITSERGMRAVIHSGARQALVEGDWVARQQWTDVLVPEVGGKVSLPLHIQSISMQYLEPVKELAGLGELWYWRPEPALLTLLSDGSKVKEINDVIDRLMNKKLRAQLKKDRRLLLDPALLMHVKYRGFADEPIGESLVEPAKLGVRYSRALTAADLVSMENIVNRLTIVKVGSADPKSPYSKADVAAARAALMQSFFEEIGPNMLIVWQGDDVSVTDVGAQQDVLSLDSRYAIAEQKIKMAIGLPDALLTGAAGDGRSSGWASIVGAAAQIGEFAQSFTSVLTTLAERVAVENNFQDIEVVWEFDGSLLSDNGQVRTNNRSDYLLGLLSIRSVLAAAGFDPQAEFTQRCVERGLDPATTMWDEVFTPPQGLQGQAADGVQGQGGGKDPGAGREPAPAAPPEE